MFKHIISFLILFYAFCLKAQEPFMRSLTTKDGLSQQQAMCYFEDSRGFVWIGTKGGLSRFDGKNFKNYDEEDGIPHNIVRNIGEDEKGNIWFTTILGLVCFDGIQFTTYRNESLGDASITVIHSRKIYIHSKDFILWENGQYIRKEDYFKGLDVNKIHRTYFDKSTESLYVCYDDSEVIHLFKNGKLEKIGNEYQNFTNIQRQNSTGELFFGRYIGGFVNYEVYRQNPDNTFSLIFKKNHDRVELFEPLKYDIYVGHFLEKQQFYIPNNTKGIFTPVENPIPECPFDYGSYYEVHSCDFYAAKQNQMLINSGQGIWQVFPKAFEPVKNPELDYAWAVVEGKNKHLFFSTYATARIFEYDGKNFKNIFDAKQREERIAGFYFGASKDAKGSVYFPHHYGILKYDKGTFSQFIDIDQSLRSDKNHCEFSFVDEARQWLIFCGYQHVKVIDLVKNIQKILSIQDGLHKSEDTEGVVKDTDGKLWLFGKQGITRWNPETNSFKSYSILNDKKVEFGGISGCVDSYGTLWIGNTFGLCYYDSIEDTFKWASNELKHYFTTVINFDKDHLILGTADGLIYILDLKDWHESHKLNLRLFNNTNGFLGGKIQHGGIYKDSKGVFWVLSATGLFRLYPDKSGIEKMNPPKVYIENIDSMSLRLNHKKDTIVLEKGHDYFQAKLGLISFEPLPKIFYSYRLKLSSDTSWSAWSESPNIFLTGLSSGIYAFEVKARPLGYEETINDTIFIKVDLPLLEEPWFKQLATILAVLLLLILIIQLTRNWYLKKQLRKNVERVRQLEVQTLQAQMNPHFIYNILSSLQNVIYQNDTKMAEYLLLRLSKLIRSYLEASVKMNTFNALSTQSDTTLHDEIELLKLYIEFEQFVRKNKFTYEIIVDPEIDIDNFTLPPIIIQPFVENAIKHGIFYKEDTGHLSLHFYKKTEDILICEVIDDGVGIQKAKAIQAKSIKSYKSLSTKLIFERINRLNQMGYNIDVVTEELSQGGTKVKIIMDYSKN